MRFRFRQLIPTKFATAYREGSNGPAIFVTWWMMWGRCFKVDRSYI